MKECVECGEMHNRNSEYCSKNCYSRAWCRVNRPAKKKRDFEPTLLDSFYISEKKRRKGRPTI